MEGSMIRGKLCSRRNNNYGNSSIDKNNRRGATPHRAELILASALVIAIGSHRAVGSTASWIGTDSANFSDVVNWSLAGGISGATSANLQFGATGNAAPVNDLTSQAWPTITFLSGAQSFVLSGNAFTLAASSASAVVNSSSVLQAIQNSVTLGGGRTVDAATGSISFAGGLAGVAGAFFGSNPKLTTPGPVSTGSVILNSAATYTTTSAATPDTTVDSSTLQIGAGGSLPSVASYGGNDTGYVVLGNSTNNTSGVLELGDSSTPINQTINSLATGGTGTGNAVVGGNSATSTLTINYLVTISTDTYSGSLGGSGMNQNNLAIIKLGPGTVALSGTNNTYNGGTTVGAGTLINNGDITESAVTVNANAIMAGNSTSGTTGTFGGAVSDGGIIAPGSSGAATGTAGTLAFLSGLSFTGASAAYDCDLQNAGSASDVLNVTGNLALGTGTTLNLNVIDSTSGSTYTIANYLGTLTGTCAAVNDLPQGYSIDYGTGSDSAITLVVPEPTSVAFAATIGSVIMLFRRRRAVNA
jgi:autotransporter-associated beta strand protein